MQDYQTYQKLISLGDTWVTLRCLGASDRDAFTRLFQQAPDEDARFMDQDFRDFAAVNRWLDDLDLAQVLPLVAVDQAAHRLIGSANLHWWGSNGARQIGEIHVFVPEPFLDQGLGTIMLHELINLAINSLLHHEKKMAETEERARS